MRGARACTSDGGFPRDPRLLKGAGIAAALSIGLMALYVGVIRTWQQHWGATEDEVKRAMPGDDRVADPVEVTTRAVTVDAAPEFIWPWLVQQGYQRGGLYSYDWIDRLIGALDRPSAERVLPEFQDLKVGDVLPYAKGTDLEVVTLEPNQALVLQYQQGDVNITHSWGLFPVDAAHTRLVLRVRVRMPVPLRMWPVVAILDPAEGFMVARQLAGIRRRAERLAAQATPSDAVSPASTIHGASQRKGGRDGRSRS